MNGIVNWNVLSSIFGNDFCFSGALVDYIKSEPLGGDVSIDFVISNRVINPPLKWEKWDKVYVKIDFSFVKRLSWHIENTQFAIQLFTIRKQQQSFEIDIRDMDNNIITFSFGVARVQNVKPLIYNEKYRRYEAY